MSKSELYLAIADCHTKLAELHRQLAEQEVEPARRLSKWMKAAELGALLNCSADTVRRRAIDGAEVFPGKRIVAQKASQRNTRFALEESTRLKQPHEIELQRRQRLI